MNKVFVAFVIVLHLLFTPALAQRGTYTFKENANGIGFSNEKGSWEFELYAGNIIKTSFQPAGYARNAQVSNAVILKPVKQEMKWGKSLERQTMHLDKNVRLTLQENALKYFVNDQFIIMADDPVRKDEFHSFIFRLLPGEKIFGGGERALPLDRRGHRFNLYNNPWYGYEYGADNLNFSVPFFISSNGYGIFFDNPSKGYVDIGKSSPHLFEAGFVSGELNFYIIPGKNVDEIMRKYTRLTGTQPVPPRWVFGNFMSRFGYQSEEQVKEVYNGMKSEGFPVDAIIFDLFWFGDSIKGTMGNLDWMNKEKWPDPAKMINDLEKESIKTILITEPFILSSTPNYQPSRAYHTVDSAGNPYTLQDFYFGQGGLIDIFRNDAQDWFWTKYQQQIRKGVAGWWGDLGEPEKHPASTFHNLRDLGFDRKFSADEVHNLYAHYWSKMLHEKYKKYYPDVRLFHLNRSGFAGSQRYSIFPWTGDVHRNWSGLRAQLPILLSMSLGGIPYIHSDAGGFAMGKKDPELYTRWLQFAAFTPVFRPHGTALGDVDPNAAHIESEPVFYPEPYKSIVRNVIRWRYDLSPYNYTLAYEQHVSGRPLMRPMFYHYSSDPESYKANDQYMWGEQVLVAPVFEQGVIEKKLYLPRGRWYNSSANTFTEGGKWITVEAGIEDIPVFIRQGAFIPTVSGLSNLEQYSTKELKVLYVPSQQGSTYTLYDDDGKTNQPVEKKKFELLQFSAKPAAQNIIITLKSNNGKFNGRPATRVIHFEIPGLEKKPAAILFNNKPVSEARSGVPVTTQSPGNIFMYDANRKMLLLSIRFSSQALVIKIRK